MRKKSSLMTNGEIESVKKDFRLTFEDVSVEDIDVDAMTEWATNSEILMTRWKVGTESRLELMKKGRKDEQGHSMLDKDYNWCLDYNPLFLFECAIADKIRGLIPDDVAMSIGTDLYEVAKRIIRYHRTEWEISQKSIDKDTAAV